MNLPVLGEVGGVMLIAVVAALAGLIWMFACERMLPTFFSGESMASGMSLTDDDEVVDVRYE